MKTTFLLSTLLAVSHGFRAETREFDINQDKPFVHDQDNHEYPEGKELPKEEFNEADFMAPYKLDSAFKPCLGSMVAIEKKIVDVDMKNQSYRANLKKDSSMAKGAT